jgi:hypothetical protein
MCSVAICCLILVSPRIWDCGCRCMCRSFAVRPYSSYIFDTFPVCLDDFLSFPFPKTSVVSAIPPYVCLVFNICFQYPELPLLFLIARIYSLYLVLNVRSVCPVYLNGQSRHLIWYTPLCSYSSPRWALLGFILCFISECDLNICFFEEFCDFFCMYSTINFQEELRKIRKI